MQNFTSHKIDDARLFSTDRAPVLLYHRIAVPRNKWEARLCVEPDMFRAQMYHLAANGMSACPFDRFVAWLCDEAPLPRRSFLLTFDDGFSDIYENAFPVLNELGWTATTFLVSTLIGKSDAWCWRENPSKTRQSLMNSSQILEMQKYGFSFQSHTRTHPFLTQVSDEELEWELMGARQELNTLLGTPVSAIAYPYGRVDDRVLAMTKRTGYSFAFSCKTGLNRPQSNLFKIRRIEVLGTDSPLHLARKMRFGTNVASFTEAVRYYPSKLAEKIKIRMFG